MGFDNHRRLSEKEVSGTSEEGRLLKMGPRGGFVFTLLFTLPDGPHAPRAPRPAEEQNQYVTYLDTTQRDEGL